VLSKQSQSPLTALVRGRLEPFVCSEWGRNTDNRSASSSVGGDPSAHAGRLVKARQREEEVVVS